jgi:hypothetical protein
VLAPRHKRHGLQNRWRLLWMLDLRMYVRQTRMFGLRIRFTSPS